MDGFFRRIWKEYGVDKVITIDRGTFLIRFNTMEHRDKILSMGRVFFDYKPVVLKPWHIDMDLNKENIQRIPIWVDAMTANRDKLQYARCMIEVMIDQAFPDIVRFKNEKNEIVNVDINYEWKPEGCRKCRKLGHDETQCYIKEKSSKEALHKEPLNTDLMQKERDAFSKYIQAHKNYMQYLRQKAEASWIKEGDDNTAIFHSCIRKRILQNNVYAIRDMGGVMQDTPEGIQGAFVDYYKELLGKAKEGRTQEKLKGACNQRELNEMRKYKVSKVYSRLKNQSLPQPWAENIWSRYNIPKYRLCTWLAIQNRLPTADRLAKMGSTIDNICPLCTNEEENNNHIFFECSYSKGILEELKQWLGIIVKSNQLQKILRWIRRKGRSMRIQKAAWNLAITAAVFLVWQIRNEIRHGKGKKDWQWTVEQTKYQVKTKINMKERSKMTETQLLWIEGL
ncbi:Exodeoxyribonuclease 7 small subunit [Bienertia sinuspersici]